MQKIRIIDSTLRDGQHALKHQLTKDNITEYCKEAELVGIDTVMVGHGNGLSASSYQVGFSLLTDKEMLITAKKQLKKTKLGAFLIPGFGTIEDMKMAIDCGVKVIQVASHCTEANITRQHIEYARKRKLEVIGVLMMSHRLDAEQLFKQAKLMQSYGVNGVMLMDSAGASLENDIALKCVQISTNLINVGYHAHNNLGLAIAGSIVAIQSGASFIDATIRGLGAGAGNCQLEVLVAVLHKHGYKTGLDVKKLCDLSEVVAKIMKEHNHQQVIDKASLASGIAGIFSGFKNHALKASKEYGVDVWDIFMELGKRNAVAGQEDLIVEIAKELQR